MENGRAFFLLIDRSIGDIHNKDKMESGSCQGNSLHSIHLNRSPFYFMDQEDHTYFHHVETAGIMSRSVSGGGGREWSFHLGSLMSDKFV